MEHSKKIPSEQYKEILEILPICCVDLVIKKGDKILLVKRKNEPLKGHFWLPGGRIYKNECLEEAAIRKAFEECGLEIIIEKNLGSYEYMGKEGPFEEIKTGVHTISVVFLASMKKDQSIKLDSQSSEYKWAKKSDIDVPLNQIVKSLKVF